MQLNKPIKPLITGLFVLTFILAFNVQISVYDMNNSRSQIENHSNQLQIDKEDTNLSRETNFDRFKFNSSGISFGLPSTPAVSVNNIVDVDQQIANNSYAYWNITLDQYIGYYLTVESIFTILINDTHSNDLDMDILYPNGTNWLSGEALTDNEIVGPTLIPEKGQYIIVIYPKTNALGLKTIMQNQVNSIRVTIVDEPTLVDNDVNYDYYGSKEQVYTIPAVGGPVETISVRSKTKISVTFGYINTGDDVSLVVTSSAGQMLSTTINGTYFIFEENRTDVYNFFLGSANLSIPVFMNITWMPFEDTLSRTYEVVAGNYDFLWESQTFNSDDFANSYFSYFAGYTGDSSHLENYKIYLYASSTVYLDIKWTLGVVDSTDDLLRFFNYEEALTGTYTKLIASNTVDHSLLTVNIGETGWYIIQVGNRALSYADTTGDSNGDTTHVYNMNIVVNDKYDSDPPFNNAPGDATGLNPNDERLGLTDNSTTPNNDDYYRVPVTGDSRLVVDVVFQYSLGVVNLFVLNSSLDIVGTSIFDLQNQQHVEVLVFSDESFFILINSTSSYDNYYNLYVNVLPIDDSYEPNDSFDEAQQLPGDGVYDLFLAKDNFDWFFLSLFRDDEITITLGFTGSLADINLFVYNSNAQLVGSSTLGISDHEEVAFIAPFTDVYLIRIRGVSATFTQPGLDYNLTISVVENDDHLEPNNSFGSARPLQDGNFPELKIRAGNEDYYQIYLKTSEKLDVSVDFNSELGDLDIILYDLSVTSVLAASQGFTGHEELSYVTGSDEEVLLRVALFEGLSVIYNMTIDIPEIDDSFGWEDNDNFDQAVFLGNETLTEVTFSDIEARGGDLDYYRVPIPKDFAIIAEITYDLALDFELFLFNSRKSEIGHSDNVTNTERIGPVPAGEATEWFIVVHMKDSGITTYNFHLVVDLKSLLLPPSTTPSAPSGTVSLGFPTIVPPGPVFDFGTGLTLTTLGVSLGVGGTIGGNLLWKNKLKGSDFFKKFKKS
jgi:hypothetical protein